MKLARLQFQLMVCVHHHPAVVAVFGVVVVELNAEARIVGIDAVVVAV